MKTLKSTFLSGLLLFSLSFGYSQETSISPSYEETVDFIIKYTKGRVMYPGALDSYKRVNGYTLEDVKISMNGDLIFITKQRNDYNDFKIAFNIFDLKSTKEYPEGIIAKDYLVHFNGLNVSSGYGITYATAEDALRVARAFRHLKKVCAKPEKGLFDKETVDEKVTLSKEETIKYINNKIQSGQWFGRARCDKVVTKTNGWGVTNRGIISDGVTNYKIASAEITDESTYVVTIQADRQCWQRGFSDFFEGTNLPYSYSLYYKIDLSKLREVKELEDDSYDDFLRLDFFYGGKELTNSYSSYQFIQRNFDEISDSYDYMYINFKLDYADMNKVKKALIHLSELIKEEKEEKKSKDPFAD